MRAVNDAVACGARREAACETVGLDPRTPERWRGGHHDDMRRGPTTAPTNKLSAEERQKRFGLLKMPIEAADGGASPKRSQELVEDRRYTRDTRPCADRCA